ncbi:MAG: hypothetical protein V3U30_00140 [Thermoplasmata archaeon]
MYRYAKLLILAGQWKEGSHAAMVRRFVDDRWEQLGDGIPDDFTLEDFDRIAENLLDLEA